MFRVAARTLKALAPRFLRDRRGNISVSMTMTILPVLAVVGVGAEGSNWYLARRAIQILGPELARRLVASLVLLGPTTAGTFSAAFALAGSHDLDRILHVVLESAMASTRASGGMVMLLNPARDQLVLAAAARRGNEGHES